MREEVVVSRDLRPHLASSSSNSIAPGTDRLCRTRACLLSPEYIHGYANIHNQISAVYLAFNLEGPLCARKTYQSTWNLVNFPRDVRKYKLPSDSIYRHMQKTSGRAHIKDSCSWCLIMLRTLRRILKNVQIGYSTKNQYALPYWVKFICGG